jgi:hypothetical protein
MSFAKVLAASVLLIAAAGLPAAFAQEKEKTRTFDFEADAAGELPQGFAAALTGGGGPVDWQVVAADDAPSGDQVVVQASQDDTRARYPLLILDELVAKNVDVEVAFKPVSGSVDQAAGIVCRLQDKDNFLIVRANALENNVVAYKTVDGERTSIGIKGDSQAYGAKTEVPPGRWSTLRVRAVDDLAEVYLNGQKLFEVEIKSLSEPGRTGLWTKADSVTQFDDLTVTVLDQ